MRELVALVAFSFVTSVTPGPNNILLWASGLQFGFRRSLPHVVGTSVGLGSMAVAVAAGIGLLVTTVPGVAIALKVVGSLYLLYLAYRIAAGGALRRGSVARPLTVLQAAAFQWVNPKAWVFALAAVGTFRPPELPILPGSVLVAVTMMVVILPSASVWAGGGTALNRVAAHAASQRALSAVLGLALVGTVAYLWL